MLFKVLVLFFVAFIIYSLVSALYFLIHDKDDSTRMVKALTWRIALSIGLFFLLILAYYMGWIVPHAV